MRLELETEKPEGEVNQEMAEKKVSPKAPAAKAEKTETKSAATRVTKKRLRKRLR